MRRITDTLTEYKRFKRFDRRVGKTAIDEINAQTRLNISYRKIKNSRSIAATHFEMEKKNTAPNSFYKEEEKDPVYLADKNSKELIPKDNYLAAQQSPYTKMLLVAGLLVGCFGYGYGVRAI